MINLWAHQKEFLHISYMCVLYRRVGNTDIAGVLLLPYIEHVSKSPPRFRPRTHGHIHRIDPDHDRRDGDEGLCIHIPVFRLLPCIDDCRGRSIIRPQVCHPRHRRTALFGPLHP